MNPYIFAKYNIILSEKSINNRIFAKYDIIVGENLLYYDIFAEFGNTFKRVPDGGKLRNFLSN